MIFTVGLSEENDSLPGLLEALLNTVSQFSSGKQFHCEELHSTRSVPPVFALCSSKELRRTKLILSVILQTAVIERKIRHCVSS